MNRQTDGQADRHTARQTNRQTYGQADSQTDKQTARHTGQVGGRASGSCVCPYGPTIYYPTACPPSNPLVVAQVTTKTNHSIGGLNQSDSLTNRQACHDFSYAEDAHIEY